MKVIFLNPPFKGKYSRTSRSPAITKSGTLYYPIWLSYAAGVLEKEGGADVRLIDAPARGLAPEAVLDGIKRDKPVLCVIDTSTPSIYSDIAMAETVKAISPETFMLLVGTHVSALPEETLSLSGSVDAVARKEYDFTVRDLYRAFRDNKTLDGVEGISFRKNGKFIHNPDRPFIEDLDAIPFVTDVYRRHLNIGDYFFSAARFPMVMTFSGRGCPHKCMWCLYPQTMHGRRYRLRSSENFFSELEFIKKEMPDIKEIGIEDDTFTASPEHCRAVCELIIKRSLKIRWWANTRASLDLETMKLMKRAGCRLLIAGFESGDQSVLNSIRKGITVEQAERFVGNARKCGLIVHGCFVVGNPGETRTSLQKTLELAMRLKLDTAQFFPMIIYPGTDAYRWAEENGHLQTEDFSKWLTDEGLHDSVINLPGLSAGQLREFCDSARKAFYLRPSYMFRKGLQSLKDVDELKRNLKGFKNLTRHMRRKRSWMK